MRKIFLFFFLILSISKYKFNEVKFIWELIPYDLLQIPPLPKNKLLLKVLFKAALAPIQHIQSTYNKNRMGVASSAERLQPSAASSGQVEIEISILS